MYVTDRTEYHAIEGKMDLAYRIAQQNSFFNSVFEGKNEPDQMIRELTNYGMNCEASHCCYFLLIDRKSMVDPGGHMPYFRNIVIEYFMKKGIQWTWSDNHGFCVLIPVAGELQKKDFGVSILKEVRLSVSHIGFSLGMACCQANAPRQLTELPRKAYLASLVAGLNQCDVSHYDEIGLYQFALQLLENDSHLKSVRELLEKLIDFDLTHNVKLLDTLECLLEYQNIKVVAGRLGVHPNTVTWRKQKIVTLLSKPLDDFTTNATLALAVKTWRIATYLGK